MISQFLLLFFLLFSSIKSQSKVGFSYEPYPDVIWCGEYFFYLSQAAQNQVKYNYSENVFLLARDGTIVQQSGGLSLGCLNQAIASIWANNKGFRLFNLDRPPNRSLQNDDVTPDVIYCPDHSVIYIFAKSSFSVDYKNNNSKGLQLNASSGDNQSGSACGSKSLTELKADSSTFNIVTQVASVTTPSISMTTMYPDIIRCRSIYYYIHKISSDQTQVTYRLLYGSSGLEYSYSNGNFVYTSQWLQSNCKNKSINEIIGQGNAFNLNTPLLECPQDITSSTQIVNYEAFSTGSLTLSYSPPQNSSFTIGQTTTVTVTATHPNSSINIQCTFGVTIPDTVPPNITCPTNIVQVNNRIVSFSASATDNTGVVPMITYSTAPGSEFLVGTTTVTATATDGNGNQAQCTLDVTIIDTQAPVLTCPANITQENNKIVSFAASASDNSGVNPTITYSKAPGSEFPVGLTTVTVKATDGSGNESQCTLTVTITDTVAPDLTCPANIIQKNDKIVNYTAACTDNSRVQPQMTYSAVSGAEFQVGETMVTVKAIDSSGNKTQCTFLVVISESEESDNMIIMIMAILGGSIGLVGIIIGTVAIAKCVKHRIQRRKKKRRIHIVQVRCDLSDSRTKL